MFKANRFENLIVCKINNEVGKLQEQVPLSGFEGNNLDIRFYAPYLLSGMQVFSDNQINFYLKDSFKPVIFESDSEKYSMLYLVMPVSQSNNG